jgi:MtrB/PioB family decaheme-associated outer membrane protein
MKRSLLISLALVCACSASAMADMTGKVELGGQLVGIQGNPSKFNEYRDLGDGITGAFDLNLSHEAYYLDMFGKNFGLNFDSNKAYRDQEFGLKFGNYENIKLGLFYNEIPHNHTFGARTFFSGIGTTTLTAPITNNAALPNATAQNPPNQFDYIRDRKVKGAELEISAKTPFFISARGEVIEVKGTLPTGANSGTIKEFPAPIDYLTQTVMLETGYRSKALTATIDGTISNFSNPNSFMTLNYTPLAAATTYTIYLPPESNNYKIGASLRYKLPFLNTVLMARGSRAQSENTIDLSREQQATVKSFNGKVVYTTAAASITSTPIEKLNTRVFFNFLDKENQSTEDFAYNPPAGFGTNATTDRFDYHKINAGLDGSYKLPAKTKVSAGYEYLKYIRGIRTDATSTTDHTLFAEVKNDYLHWLSAKARYQHLMRSSDNLDPGLYATSTASDQILAFWRPVDTADRTQDAIKVGVEIEPMHNLAFGAEYSFKNSEFDKTILGVKKDIRHELYVDATYTAGIVKLNTYFDVEFLTLGTNSRRYQDVGAGSPFSGINNVNNYNWASTRRDYNYAVGLNADVDVIKNRMTVGAGYRYESVDGTEDFGASFSPLAPVLAKNTQVDNQIKQTLTAKMGYNITPSLKLDISYLYENFRYNDDHWVGYNYAPTAGTNLTGAYANPNYEAHVGFMKLGYKF